MKIQDKVTMPWISEAEIPAIKLVLSKWRQLRHSSLWVSEQKVNTETNVDKLTETAAKCCQMISILNDNAKSSN